jgi:uncharacterized protein YkwD
VRPPRILLLLCCAALAGAAVPGAQSADDPYAALLAPSGQCGAAADQLGLEQAAAQQAMTCLTNYARVQSGLVPLQSNSALNAAGQAKLAADLSCGEFSHTPCGQPFTGVFGTYLQGATSYGVGENLLTADYRELGIGYLADQTFQGYAGATLWSEEFGVRTPASPSTSGPTSSPQPARLQPVSAPVATKPVLKKQPTRHRKTRRRLHLHG